MHFVVTAIYLTNVTFSMTATLSNGSTYPMGSMTENVTSGSGTSFIPILVVPGLNVGDPIFYNYPLVITSQEGEIFAGATRTVDYCSFNAGGTIMRFKWDKATGLIVALNVTQMGLTGSITLTSTNLWTPTTPTLYVNISPLAPTINIDSDITFTATAYEGTSPYTNYTWQVNGILEQWGPNPTFSMTHVSQGSYIVTVTVTDTALDYANATTMLTATPPLSVQISPLDPTIPAGQSQLFTASASGGLPPYTYNWYVDDTLEQSGYNPTFSYTPLSVGVYIVNVTVTDSALTSVNATTTLTATTPLPLFVSISPTNATINFGESVTFDAYASGGIPPYYYEWEYRATSGGGSQGGGSPTLELTPWSTGVYLVDLTVTDSGSPTSSATANTVLMVTQPGPLSSVEIFSLYHDITVGQSAVFYAYAIGGLPPFTYYWYVNDSLATMEETDGYTYYSFMPETPGYYIVNVTVTDYTAASTSTITAFWLYPLEPLTPVYFSPWSWNPTITLGNYQLFDANWGGGLPPFTCDWYVDGSLVSTRTTYDRWASYSFMPLSVGVYTVTLTVTDSELPPVSASNSSTLTVISDTTPPATITDLATSSPTLTSITLTWTAPGDDDMSGTAAGYIVKYSTTGEITDENWDTATTYTQSWYPQPAGSTETYEITGLYSATTYWFAIKAYDEVPNYGGVSNSPSATTLTPPPEYLNVGVKVGDTANYSLSITGLPFDRMYVVITGVSGTIVTGTMTLYFPDGTSAGTMPWDFDISTSSSMVGMPFPLLIAANLMAGQAAYAGTPLIINETIPMMICGATRNVNHLSTAGYEGGAGDVYWDKLTGLMVKFSVYNYVQSTWMNVTLTSTSIDLIPPATITDLATSSPTLTSITLTWTAPGDDDMSGTAAGYIVKYSTTGEITDENWDTATTYTQSWYPQPAGSTETYEITGLAPDTTYWFAIKAYDEVPNYGGVSNSPSATTLTPDTTPPATIIDLATNAPTGNSITLTWTAPGDDGMSGTATGYWVKYSTTGEITDANWDSATNYTQYWTPQPAGSMEIQMITGLAPDTTYWFAIKAYDEVPNYSGVSNSPSGTTLDTISPAAITDVATSSPTFSSITLTWTAPGDDGNVGTAAGYIVKYSTSGPISDLNWDTTTTYTQYWMPQPAGSTETQVITGLYFGTTYWFAIKAYDEVPNYGGVSNSPSAATLTPPPEYLKIGVKAGYTANYSVSTTYPPMDRMSIAITSVSGTIVSGTMTVHYLNGTIAVQPFSFDISVSTMWQILIACNLTAGKSVYAGSPMIINETIPMMICGATRTVNHLELTNYQGQSVDAYWDKLTGIIVRVSVHNFVPSMWSNMSLTSTSIWSDVTAPSAVSDLATSSPTATSITLTWTAPGDDGMIGNVKGYIVKYSTTGPITSDNWGSATTYTQTWTPAKSGTTETHIITGLYANTTYWFAIKAYDDVTPPNYGDVSNSLSGRTLGVSSTTPAGFFGQNGFSIWTNGSSVVVTSLSTQPSGTGSPPTGTTPFIYFEMQGSLAPGSHIAIVKLYYNITKVHELGLNETTLALYTWNSATSNWDTIPTTNIAINTTYGLLTAYVSHFSYFAVFATAPTAAGGLPVTTIIMIAGAVGVIVVVLAVVLFLKKKR